MPKRCAWNSYPYYERLIGPLRRKARKLGYAIGVHGTLKRDIDLIACPWTEHAVPPRTLVEQLYKTLRRIFPRQVVVHSGQTKDRWYQVGKPGVKCFGRLIWTFHWIDFRGYIDLSVMPRWKT